MGEVEITPCDALVTMLRRQIDVQPILSREMRGEALQILCRPPKVVGLKQAAQLDTILKTKRESLSTDELDWLVQNKDAKISFTTLCRRLKLFTECGLASGVGFDRNPRFEYRYARRRYPYMVCPRWAQSAEFLSPVVNSLEPEMGKRHQGESARHTFQICSLCEESRKKKGSLA